MIGIRLADGKYYPVFDESERKRKRFVLTPANDNQQIVHVLFFKSDNDSFSDAQLLGSVNLDNIPPGLKDEREISIVIGLDDNDSLEVSARDESGGYEHQLILNTNPTNQEMIDNNLFDEDAFQLEEDLDLPMPEEFIGDKEDMETLHRQSAAGSDLDADPSADMDWDDNLSDSYVQNKKPLKPGIIAALVLVIAAALVLLSFLLFKLIQGEPIPPMEASRGLRLSMEFRAVVISLLA